LQEQKIRNWGRCLRGEVAKRKKKKSEAEGNKDPMATEFALPKKKKVEIKGKKGDGLRHGGYYTLLSGHNYNPRFH